MTQFQFGPKQSRWLEELESGVHHQTTGALCKNGDYCCLGVAARHVLHLSERVSYDDETILFNGDSGALNSDWGALGLHSMVGRIDLDALDVQTRQRLEPLGSDDSAAVISLALMNDHGWSFAQIAQFIRANPRAVFTHSV